MSRVDIIEDQLWQFLAVEHRNEGFTLPTLLTTLGLRNNSDTRKAITKRLRERAISEGLYAPYPCPANGQTYAVVDDPNMVFDTAMHKHRVIEGWQVAHDADQRFMRAHAQRLPRNDRELVNLIEEVRETQRQQDALINRMVGMVIEQRRENRKDTDGLVST